MKSKKGKKKNKVCVYCGKKGRPEEKLTKDHIPPKNLFAPPRPDFPALITVPCCQQCNSKASLDDEYFWKQLVFCKDIEDHHPDAKALKPKVIRAYSKEKQRRCLDALLSGVRREDVYTPAGIYLGKAWSYPVDWEIMDRVVSRIVAGLYYHHYSHRVPDTFTISSFSLDENQFSNKDRFMEYIKFASVLYKNQPNVIGNNVFAYWHQFFGNHETSSFWLLRFYGLAHWLTLIHPRAWEDEWKSSESVLSTRFQ